MSQDKKTKSIQMLLLGKLYNKCVQNPEDVSVEELDEQLQLLKKEFGCLKDCSVKDFTDFCQFGRIPDCFMDGDRECVEKFREKEWKEAIKSGKQDIVSAYNNYKLAKNLELYGDDDDDEEEEEDLREICTTCLRVEHLKTLEEPRKFSCGHYAHLECLIDTAVAKKFSNASCGECRKEYQLQEVPVPVRTQEQIERDSEFRTYANQEQMGFITKEQLRKREEEYDGWLLFAKNVRDEYKDRSNNEIQNMINQKWNRIVTARYERERRENQEQVEREYEEKKELEYKEYDNLYQEKQITEEQLEKRKSDYELYESIVRLINNLQISKHKRFSRSQATYAQMKQRQLEREQGLVNLIEKEATYKLIRKILDNIQKLSKDIMNPALSRKKNKKVGRWILKLYQELEVKMPNRFVQSLNDFGLTISKKIKTTLEALPNYFAKLSNQRYDEIFEILHHFVSIEDSKFHMRDPKEIAINDIVQEYIEEIQQLFIDYDEEQVTNLFDAIFRSIRIKRRTQKILYQDLPQDFKNLLAKLRENIQDEEGIKNYELLVSSEDQLKEYELKRSIRAIVRGYQDDLEEFLNHNKERGVDNRQNSRLQSHLRDMIQDFDRIQFDNSYHNFRYEQLPSDFKDLVLEIVNLPGVSAKTKTIYNKLILKGVQDDDEKQVTRNLLLDFDAAEEEEKEYTLQSYLEEPEDLPQSEEESVQYSDEEEDDDNEEWTGEEENELMDLIEEQQETVIQILRANHNQEFIDRLTGTLETFETREFLDWAERNEAINIFDIVFYIDWITSEDQHREMYVNRLGLWMPLHLLNQQSTYNIELPLDQQYAMYRTFIGKLMLEYKQNIEDEEISTMFYNMIRSTLQYMLLARDTFPLFDSDSFKLIQFLLHLASLIHSKKIYKWIVQFYIENFDQDEDIIMNSENLDRFINMRRFKKQLQDLLNEDENSERENSERENSERENSERENSEQSEYEEAYGEDD